MEGTFFCCAADYRILNPVLAQTTPNILDRSFHPGFRGARYDARIMNDPPVCGRETACLLWMQYVFYTRCFSVYILLFLGVFVCILDFFRCLLRIFGRKYAYYIIKIVLILRFCVYIKIKLILYCILVYRDEKWITLIRLQVHFSIFFFTVCFVQCTYETHRSI